jgi:hypothetical protein
MHGPNVAGKMAEILGWSRDWFGRNRKPWDPTAKERPNDNGANHTRRRKTRRTKWHAGPGCSLRIGQDIGVVTRSNRSQVGNHGIGPPKTAQSRGPTGGDGAKKRGGSNGMRGPNVACRMAEKMAWSRDRIGPKSETMGSDRQDGTDPEGQQVRMVQKNAAHTAVCGALV